MPKYIDEMNALIKKADFYTFDDKDYQRAESLYQEALKFNDAYPAYCYGKFLYALQRRDEAKSYIDQALLANFAPAALFQAAVYVKENGYPIQDVFILEKLKEAAESGHLVAKQYLLQDRVHNAEKLISLPKLILRHWILSKKIRRIKKDRKVSQESIWF